MTPRQRAELLCTVGRVVVRTSYVVGFIPAALTVAALVVYIFGKTILDEGNRQWNDLHWIENPPVPTTAVEEAERVMKAWGIKI